MRAAVKWATWFAHFDEDAISVVAMCSTVATDAWLAGQY